VKVFKPHELSLWVKPFGVGGRLRLACSVFVLFDLADPDRLLTEQELWGTVPGQLGATPILDLGMPKPRGEFLAAGSCCAPRGRPVPAQPVSLRVGGIQKALAVFGDRFWERGPLGLHHITDPVPFAEMPIRWENAFGGAGFEQNPAGKGLRPVPGPDGRERRPLPNVEHFGRIVGAPADRPEPAGFGPLDLMHPARQRKTGTYDQRWLEERWPYFPDDLNYEYFNAAPEDQYLNGFFSGDEELEISGMHPDRPRIVSRLPRVRVRCFVTRQKDLRSRAEADLLFEEVPTRIDTLWLFPSILRGVLICRGTTTILDEEYADVQRVFLACEQSGDPFRTLEEYRDLQLRAVDRAVPVDLAPLRAAQPRIAAALKRCRRLPKEIAAFKRKVTGQAPAMPRTPEDMSRLVGELIADGQAVLDRLEPLAKDLHARFGHLVAIDLGQFDAWRQRLGQMEQSVARSVEKVRQAQQAADRMRQEMGRQLQQHVSKEQLDRSGLDPDQLWPLKKVNPWHDRGFPLAVDWRRSLECDRPARNRLERLGLEQKTISDAWLGINPAPLEDLLSAWGTSGSTAGAETFSLPAGLVLPRFVGSVLTGLAVRPGTPGEWEQSEETVRVPGSDETPLYLPPPPGPAPPVVVRAADDFQALLLEQEVGDAFGVIALARPEEQPGEEAGQAIQDAPVFVVALPEKSAEVEKTGWRGAFPNALVLELPRGRTAFAARAAGLDLRKWILDALPAEMAEPHRLEVALPEPGQPPGRSFAAGFRLPIPDIQALVKSMLTEVRAHFQPVIDTAMAENNQAIGKLEEVLRGVGQDPEKVLGTPGTVKPVSLADSGAAMAGQLTAQRDRLQSLGVLAPEQEQRLTGAAARILRMSQDGEAQYRDGLARIAEGKEKIAQFKAGELPAGFKEQFEAAGLDPSRLRKRTREEVVTRHARGESLAGANLAGLDLSGLELPGLDLTGALCQETDFSGTDLRGALLVQMIAPKVNLSRAILREATLDFSVFAEPRFAGADLGGARLKQVVLREPDLFGANLAGARLEMTTLQGARLKGACLHDLDGYLSIIEGDASDADFTAVRLKKCILRKIVLDRADFRGAALNSTLLQDARGEAVTFAGANLDKLRVGGATALPGACFRDVRMHQGSLREADLSGVDFRGADIAESLFEYCLLREARLDGVMARGARLTKSDLEGANLRGINLFEGSLRKARLVGADLRAAYLCAVDLYKAVMGETCLDGANLKFTLLNRRKDLLP